MCVLGAYLWNPTSGSGGCVGGGSISGAAGASDEDVRALGFELFWDLPGIYRSSVEVC